jgi:hypothetical protein
MMQHCHVTTDIQSSLSSTQKFNWSSLNYAAIWMQGFLGEHERLVQFTFDSPEMNDLNDRFNAEDKIGAGTHI